MSIPQGYNENVGMTAGTECLVLDKAIYGLVRAERQFWKCFHQGDSYMWIPGHGPCMLVIHIDDMTIARSDDAIDNAVAGRKQHISITEDVNLQDYLRIKNSLKR
jgi:hypothetical protein